MKKSIYLSFSALLFTLLLFGQSDSTLYPVSLSSFKASGTGTNVNLKWETICYLSFANFDVQRSGDGRNFTTFHSFTADRLRCRQPFYLSDDLTTADSAVFYRINVSDKDGRQYHSKTVRWRTEGISSKFLGVYPNVISSQTNIVLSSPVAGVVTLALVNTAGSIVKTYQYNVSKGVTNLTLDVSGISEGKYWLSATDAMGIKHTASIIKL